MTKLGLDNYTINKQMYAKIDPPTTEQVNQMFTNVGAWLSTHYKKHYYMLLNNELHYYTIFNLKSPNFNQMVDEFKQCLAFRGQVLDIEYQHAEDCYQIWIKDYKTKEVYMYMLFEAEDFVVEVE